MLFSRCLRQRKYGPFSVPCASSNPTISCVIYASTNVSESEKKRENLKKGHKKSLVIQLFTRLLSARDARGTMIDIQCLMFRISSFSTNIQFDFDDKLFKRSYSAVHLSTLTFLYPGCSSPEIIIHRKRKLLDEQLFISRQIILLVEKDHGIFVVDRLNATIRQRTIAVFDVHFLRPERISLCACCLPP